MASIAAQVSLSAKTSGNGATVDFLVAVRNVTMVAYTTGLVTGGLVQIEASQDGTVWVPIQAVEVGSRPRSVDLSGGAFRYWRATVQSAIVGGGTTTATFMEAG